jgi:hypothetical protein
MFVPATFFIGFGLVINVADTLPRYNVKPACSATINLSASPEGRTVEAAWPARKRLVGN